MTGRHDVVVLGGGPAGFAASTMLARRGHDVALVRPTVTPAGALAESIPPSARKLLAELGVLGDLEQADFQRNGGNTVWWAGKEARAESFEDGRFGFHVDRTGLERVMAAGARTFGVQVQNARASAVRESGRGWAVSCRDDAGRAYDLTTEWLLDATGRRGLLARREGRESDRSTTTVALVRRWGRAGGFTGVEPFHTLVESYRDGWAWSVPLDRETRCVTAMIDHRYVHVAGPNLDAVLDAQLDRAPRVGTVRSGAVPLGPAWACPASLYTAARFGRRGLLLVGDAGSFIDPLSSFGVKKALSSGWLAAVAVHTALADATMTDVAVDFFDRREREVYRTYRARSAPFFEACAEVYGHEYWAARARAARTAGGVATATDSSAVGNLLGARETDPDSLEEGAALVEDARAALEGIRGRAGLDAVRGPSVHSVRRPTIIGFRVALAEHLASSRVPNGLRHVRNVDIPRLVDVAVRHRDVTAGWAEYNTGAPRVALPDYLAALATAFAAELLVHSDTERPNAK